MILPLSSRTRFGNSVSASSGSFVIFPILIKTFPRFGTLFTKISVSLTQIGITGALFTIDDINHLVLSFGDLISMASFLAISLVPDGATKNIRGLSSFADLSIQIVFLIA